MQPTPDPLLHRAHWWAAAAAAAIAVALTLGATPARAQYGDAYHPPNNARLSQMAGERAARQAQDHADRIRNATSTRPSPVMVIPASPNSWVIDTSRAQRFDALQAQRAADDDALRARVQRLDALIAELKLQRSPEHHDALWAAARQVGFNDQQLVYMFGSSADAYAQKLRQAAAADAARRGSPYSGSTRASCADGCTETLQVAGGGRYTGQTAGGVPQGRGTITLANRDAFSGNWAGGRLAGDIEVRAASGDVYTGGFDRGLFNGVGRYTWKSGTWDAGTFVDSRLDGPAERGGVASGVRFVQRGSWRAGVPVGVHETVLDGGAQVRAVEDFDQPALDRIEWRSGRLFTGTQRNGTPVDGTLRCPDGATFTGLFHDNGSPRSGLMKLADGSVQYGSFNPQGRQHGYMAAQFADSSAAEMIMDNDRRAGAVLRTRSNGDVLTGTALQPGFQIHGMLLAKGEAAVRPVGLAGNGDFIDLPPEQHGAAREHARRAAETIIAERGKLAALLER